MMLPVKYGLLLLLAFVPASKLFSQLQFSDSSGTVNEKIAIVAREENKPFTVRKIIITGNKKTREAVILREIPFKAGEEYQLAELVKNFEVARRNLMNTALFNEVLVALKSFEGYHIDISVEVKERWYLFPIPYFKMVDRNLNQWLVEQNAKLNRVNYGIKLLYNNATGNNDKLNILLMDGYTKQISFNYDRLYIDKKMKWGFTTGFSIGKNKEVNYNTFNNKQLFFKDTNNFVRSFKKANIELTYRPAIKTRHRFGFSYSEEKVIDTIISLNPAYFKNGNDKVVFPEFYYLFNYRDVDYIPYPLKGYMVEASFSKRGFNKSVNLWQLNAKASGSWEISDKTYFSTIISGKVKFPFSQPYFNQRLLGYSDFFMQGYEYYVVDGVAGGFIKTSVTRELFNFYMQVKRKKATDYYHIPFRIYAKAFTNAGYIHHPSPGENSLNNRMLYSGGVGIDIITHYDFTIKLEWSFNQLGQNGLYLHRRSF
jgi:outer membrane protein assembly factor BamA